MTARPLTLIDNAGEPTAEAIAGSPPRSARWLAAAPYAGTDDIAVAFLDFHDRNPEVYDQLVALCRRARSRGVTRVGVGMLWEVLRWEFALYGLPDRRETFKLNNNYRSRYARLIMATEPDLADVFEVRWLRSC